MATKEAPGLGAEQLDYLEHLGATKPDANRKPEWLGASRAQQWIPPQFLQTYGNYTGMFPSLGQQVGQSLYGSIQAQGYQPPWMQTMLPSRQNNAWDYSRYSPFQSGGRTMGNPYPLNGRVNLTTPNIGVVQNWSNPFIGAYEGLTGFPGNGPQQPGVQQPPPPPPPQQPPPQQPPPITPPQPVPPNPPTTPLPIPPMPQTQPGGTVIGTNPGGFPWTPQPTPPNPFQPGIMPSGGQPPAPSPSPFEPPANHPTFPGPQAPSLGGHVFPGGQQQPGVTPPQITPSAAMNFLRANPQILKGLLGY